MPGPKSSSRSRSNAPRHQLAFAPLPAFRRYQHDGRLSHRRAAIGNFPFAFDVNCVRITFLLLDASAAKCSMKPSANSGEEPKMKATRDHGGQVPTGFPTSFTLTSEAFRACTRGFLQFSIGHRGKSTG